MYNVIKEFADRLDDGHIYNVGDVYPRDGITASDERIKELSSNENAVGEPLIAEVKPAKKKAVRKAAPKE